MLTKSIFILCSLVFVVTISLNGQIVICEIMANPSQVEDAKGEWFEVYNNTSNPINMKNWVIMDNGVDHHTISSDLIVQPNDVVVLARNGDTGSNGNFNADYVYSSFQLANTDDEVIIKDDMGNGIDSVKYNKSNGWPIYAGHSMTLHVNNPNVDNNDPSVWIKENSQTYGLGDYGTPGFISGDQSLPVELSSFTASFHNNIVTLRWTTQSEIDNQGFYVLRATNEDGEYVQISPLIAGAGTSSERHDYLFHDRNIETGRNLWYKIKQVDYDGAVKIYGPIMVTTAERQGSAREGILPDESRLIGNFPNPFNPGTTLSFVIGGDRPVRARLQIYDVLGRKVKEVLNQMCPPGFYDIPWNGDDRDGRLLPGGIYYCRMTTSTGYLQTIKLIRID